MTNKNKCDCDGRHFKMAEKAFKTFENHSKDDEIDT